MSDHWTLPRISTNLHRMILGPLGFARRGNSCVRSDELDRTIKFYGLRATVPQVQILLTVGLRGLPPSVGPYRRDVLWAPLEPERGPNHYRRPPSGEALPADLVNDVAGPGMEFLLEAADLAEFAVWGETIYDGDGQSSCWRRFRPVMPQGTGPLQAAAYAAAKGGDEVTCQRLAARVIALEHDRAERTRFQAELARFAPTVAAILPQPGQP